MVGQDVAEVLLHQIIATVLKIHNTKKKSYGITLVELVAIGGIVSLLILVVLIIVNPVEILAKGRDERRLGDLSSLDRAINEYSLDNKVYPDLADTTRLSNSLPAGNSGPLSDPADGWIDADMTSYVTRLPIDPINDSTYKYVYRHTLHSYELNVDLEFYVEYEDNSSDGGDDGDLYELGNDLTIL